MDALSTAIITAVTSAGISYYISNITKKKDYQNDYFKKVIDKRMAVYELVERAVSDMQFSMVNNEEKHYLSVYSSEETYNSFTANIRACLKSGMWLGKNAQEQLQHINSYIYNTSKKHNMKNKEEIVAAGVEAYDLLTKMSAKLETFVKTDMFNLYDVPRFFETRR